MLLGVSTAQAENVQEIARRAFGSTVLLVMEDANGQTLSLGSGFFVRDGVIASNLHVIEGAASGYAKLVGQKTKYEVEGVTALDPERKLYSSRFRVLAHRHSLLATVALFTSGNPSML